MDLQEWEAMPDVVRNHIVELVTKDDAVFIGVRVDNFLAALDAAGYAITKKPVQ